MARFKIALALAGIFALAFAAACVLVSTEASFTASHPMELGAGRPNCSACHADEPMTNHVRPYSEFDHTTSFIKAHGLQAVQFNNVCASCHPHSFCAACHADKTVLKPSLRNINRPDLVSPHRGDYMTLHRIEGKIDPASCYRCHGRANNDRCRACHR
jgi:hypothetical protein